MMTIRRPHGSASFLVFASWLWACAPESSSSDADFRNLEHDGHWATLETRGVGPTGRSAPAVAALGRNVYVFGGSQDDVVNGDVVLFDELYRFDTVRNRWQPIEPDGPRPTARAFASAAADPQERHVLVYGGASFGAFFSDFVALGDLWAYDVQTRSWIELVSTNAAPLGRSGATVWRDGRALYVFGGITTAFEARNDLWAFDLDTHTWTELIPQGAPGSPPPRHEAQSGGRVQGDRVLVYGGEALDETFTFVTLADTWSYAPSTGTWTELTPEPSDDIDPPRYLGASAVLGPRLFLHGGDIPGGDLCGAVFAQNPTDELWSFDPRRRVWSPLIPKGAPLPRLKRTRGVGVRGSMFVFGGYDFACDDGLPSQIWNTDVFRYQP